MFLVKVKTLKRVKRERREEEKEGGGHSYGKD